MTIFHLPAGANLNLVFFANSNRRLRVGWAHSALKNAQNELIFAKETFGGVAGI
jgi:hypothetical protein